MDLDDYNTGNSTLPSSTPGLWVNLNLRVLFGNYTLLNGWQGNDWFNIAPSFKILIANNTPYHNDTTLSIR